MSKKRVGITATGSYFPPRIVTNDDFAKTLDTSDEWIRTRTGVRQRHFVEPGTGASDLAHPAVTSMLQERGISAEEIDLILFATVTPDTMFPSTACRLQDMLGAKNAWGFDLSAACSSFLYALATGIEFVASGRSTKCVVVGADVMSSIVDQTDRATAVLFGDGAGCVLLEPVSRFGYIDDDLHIDGAGGQHLYMPAGGSKLPASEETVANRQHFVHQNGREVFKHAVIALAQVSSDILKKHGKTAQDLKLFIPHQANIRIINNTAHRLKLSPDQVMVNIDRRANTTAATLPTCMDEAVRTQRLNPGDLVLLSTFGAGFTWGSALLEWAY